MSTRAFSALILLLVGCAGCAPRVNLVTGTTIGLKATPGDGQTRPPQVTFGYKRAEVSLVPTYGTGATVDSDAQSVLATIHFSTRWFGHTELDSFMATGMASRNLVASSEYAEELARVTLGVVSDAVQQRRLKLARQVASLTEPQAQDVLKNLKYDRKTNKDALASLLDYVEEARTDVLLERLEAAFYRRQ